MGVTPTAAATTPSLRAGVAAVVAGVGAEAATATGEMLAASLAIRRVIIRSSRSAALSMNSMNFVIRASELTSLFPSPVGAVRGSPTSVLLLLLVLSLVVFP